MYLFIYKINILQVIECLFYLFIYPFTYMANVLQATNCLTYLPT
jgi:hypothetical protein